MKPRISIIVPVYNVERYIEECLQSVANQSIADLLECIIVDDCGFDKSIDIAKNFVEQFNSLRTTNHSTLVFTILQREENGGLSLARNTGVKVATGEYLYFLDSDDTIIPTAMEQMLSLADKYGGVDLLPALYITDGHDMEQFGAHSFPEFSNNRSLIKRSLLDYDKMPITATNRLVRRQFFLEHFLWFKEGIIHEDNYWTFFLAKHVQRMAFTSEKLYFYRSTEGSITTKENIENRALAFNTIITDFSNNIDSFEKGAQKKIIFLLLLQMWNNGFYASEAERDQLTKLFVSKNNIIEKLVLKMVFNSSNKSFLYYKSVNLLQRLYNLR